MADASPPHRALVDALVGRNAIKDPRIEAAFRAIPRHLFLPGVPLAEAYRNEAIPTKIADGEAISSSSQPEIMAIMLDQLALVPGMRVLEIGAGTGYNAALMAHVVGVTGAVTTMDVDADLVSGARAHLASAGLDRVHVVLGDGGRGHPDGAPYDRIILTVGAWDIAPAWAEQLRPGGRLVLPLTVGGSQKSVAFVRAADQLVSASVTDCAFMRLRGAFAGPPTRIALGDTPYLRLHVREPAAVDARAAYEQLLKGPPTDLPTGVTVVGREVYGGLVLWLALREAGFCWLEAVGSEADAQPVPNLFVVAGQHRSAPGVFDADGAGFYMRPPEEPATDGADAERSFELHVRGFGARTETMRRLGRHAQAWDRAGRPGSDGLRIRALPIEVGYVPGAGEHVIEKRWMRLVLDWPDRI